jgi:hypothetical protein
VPFGWDASPVDYRDDEFDVVDDDGRGLSDVDDLCDQDDG